MTGIVAYGVHIPFHRLNGEVVGAAWGKKLGKGERAVANQDEDSITMAVEAGMNCLRDIDKNSIDGLFFASTTAPFAEKSSATIVAAALDLPNRIVTADFANSLRSGTIALKLACDIVASGIYGNLLVIASDCRVPAPNTDMELFYGDGAAAFLVGKGDVVLERKGSSQLSSEFIDTWRLPNDRFPKKWEDRFIRDEGYEKFLPKVVSDVLEALQLTPKDIAKAAYYALSARDHAALARTLGMDASTQVQDPLVNRLGNAGAASAFINLIAAAEGAKPGDRILMANYGDGADASVFELKTRTAGKIQKYLDSKLMIGNYGQYMMYKQLAQFEETFETGPRTSLSLTWRDRDIIYRFHGFECKKCGHVQFPAREICVYCQSRELAPVRLAEKKGKLFTFSIDERAGVGDPPNIVSEVDIEGGGRFHGQMTDRDPKNVRIGMPVEFTFRRIHSNLGVPNYFWKCRPVR